MAHVVSYVRSEANATFLVVQLLGGDRGRDVVGTGTGTGGGRMFLRKDRPEARRIRCRQRSR